MSDKIRSRLGQVWFKQAKYKDKKTIKNKDGDETTVYEYSDRQVNKRHKEKSKKVEKIRQNIDALEKKIYSDLKGKENKMVALAVALINHTYERVGNDESASNGHYGVTGWKKKHLSFKGDTAILKYTGKSGVRHEKEITDKKLVSALKEVSEGLSKDDCLLEEIDASDVNEYLDQFGITAKDIRGYHANREMQERLKALREENGELPKNRKEKEQQLKDEFKEALEGAAKAVGHEGATLRKQYLVPHLEETYMKDGTVITTLKKASLVRIASQVFATKSQSEKEDEEVERLQKPSPKKKPPRKDKSRRRVKIEDKDIDKDPDMNTKDMSMNYKIVGSELERVWFRGAKDDLKTVRRVEDDKVVQVSEQTLSERPSDFVEVEDTESKKQEQGEETTTEKGTDTSTEPSPEKVQEDQAKKEQEKEEANKQSEKVKEDFGKTLKDNQDALEFLSDNGDNIEGLLSEEADTLSGVEKMKAVLKDKKSLLEVIQDAIDSEYGSDFMEAVQDILGEGLDTSVSVSLIDALKKAVDEGLTTPVRELAELSLDEIEQRILDEAELKEEHTKETKALKEKYKGQVREKFEALSSEGADLSNIHSVLSDSSDSELSYFSDIVKEPLEQLSQVERDLEDKKGSLEKAEGRERRTLEKEIKELEQSKKELEESVPKMSTIKNMVNVNAILRGQEDSIVGEVSDKQKSLISFLGKHLSPENVLDSMSQISSVSDQRDNEVQSKVQMQLAIGNSMRELSMDQKMSILNDQDLFDDNKDFIDAFRRYADRAKSPLISAKKRQELEDLADMMFSRAMSETLAGSDNSESKENSKKDSLPYTSREKAKERTGLLTAISQVIEEELGSFLDDPDVVNDTDIAEVRESVETAIQSESVRKMYDKRMEGASEQERKLLEKQKEQAIDRMTKKAKIRSNLITLWGKI